MSQTELPSWVGRVPSGAGKASNGKLKADEWKMLGNVSLVHTLGRLWGDSRVPTQTKRQRELFDNYMDLVAATKLASSRILTISKIDGCRRHIQCYLYGLRKLFPDIKISPNQHLAAHLPDLLVSFGPTHSWRCFPFERYNQMLQQLNTNNKPGMLCDYRVTVLPH
jgi:hypothetical protein